MIPSATDPPSRRPLVTSSGRRLLRLGSLVGKVGISIAGDRALGLLRRGPSAEARRLDNLIKNAVRIAETLGEMKGAAMKVGQMLSLHAGWLPPEVATILSRLQRDAPRVPPEVMRYEVEGSLGAPIDELFAEFEDEGFAAASIGQVHLARLTDGRQVAVKVQYPMIREIVTADLGNLETLFKSLFSLFSEADFRPLWEEVRDRLLEELDYQREAESMGRLRGLHRELPEIIIPQVISERSSDRVLTMEFVEGIAPADAASERYPQQLRDRWGQTLLEFQLRGLFEHRWLHADPNFANFAFREDGRLIVYDFGSVKRVPEPLARGYARIAAAVLDGEHGRVPLILAGIGAHRTDGEPLGIELIDPYLDLLANILRSEPLFRFGDDLEIYDRIMELGMKNWSQARNLQFPHDVIFIDRSLAGHLGNLSRLRSGGRWRTLLESYIEPYR